ncbi:MAG: dehydrogenase [Hyphomicrobiales bacterium]|nr:MAG: dehydrogenase [Hyphomicrobiales bacterium]
MTFHIGHSTCPHDCPSTCALDVEIDENGRIGRLRGAKDNSYTAGVICAKVARYAERLYNPKRVLKPLKRTGPKGSGQFTEISWDDALDIVAENFLKVEAEFGAQAVWPTHYAGTMGLVQRDSLQRLRYSKSYSRQFDSFCSNMATTGFVGGTGKLAGPDPREMAKSDCVVIWGTNPVATQVNVMTHAVAARKNRGAKIVVVDVYRTETAKQADMALILKPGTDGALACAVMHILFRDGHADRAYLERYAEGTEALEAHLSTRTPQWAAEITGLSVEEIETFARLIGTTNKTFLRLGYGFTRQRNGVVSMHAAMSIATVAGLWQYEGGGAFHNNGALYKLDKTMVEGLDVLDTSVRALDHSRMGEILTGEAEALLGGPPVKAVFTQNTNPVLVAPDQNKVRKGFFRDDLFVCVHEQVMTETARMADIVLPATMFLEHDDIYRGGGHQYFMLGPKLLEAPGEARENVDVIAEIAKRVGAEHPGFAMSAREHIDWMLQRADLGSYDELKEKRWIDMQPDFETSHYLNGFATPSGRYRFAVDWATVDSPCKAGPFGPVEAMPSLPDFWPVIEAADDEHPFRLTTSPARNFLNSTFNETETSLAREVRPEVMIHPSAAERLGIAEGDLVEIGNMRGTVRLHARLFDGLQQGVLVSESIWPSEAFVDGRGINCLTGSDPIAPYGGPAFHDIKVWLKPAAA